MATQVCIDFEQLIYKAYKMGINHDEDSEKLTKTQLRNILLADIPLFAVPERSAEPNGVKKRKTKDESEPKEKKSRGPRAVPEDDTRCCARNFKEKEHLEDGSLKIMRDDKDNLFGDRCKFKKTEGDFCKHHETKQPFGIWGGEYEGKFLGYMSKTKKTSGSDSEKPAKKAPKKAESDSEDEKPVKKHSKKAESDSEDEKPVAKKAPKKKAESDSEDEKPVAKKAPKKAESDSEDEEHSDDEFYSEIVKGIPEDTEIVEIDEMDYYVDKKNNVYDPETEKLIGTYDRAKNRIIKK